MSPAVPAQLFGSVNNAMLTIRSASSCLIIPASSSQHLNAIRIPSSQRKCTSAHDVLRGLQETSGDASGCEQLHTCHLRGTYAPRYARLHCEERIDEREVETKFGLPAAQTKRTICNMLLRCCWTMNWSVMIYIGRRRAYQAMGALAFVTAK
jgi:hypothetical protein